MSLQPKLRLLSRRGVIGVSTGLLWVSSVVGGPWTWLGNIWACWGLSLGLLWDLDLLDVVGIPRMAVDGLGVVQGPWGWWGFGEDIGGCWGCWGTLIVSSCCGR